MFTYNLMESWTAVKKLQGFSEYQNDTGLRADFKKTEKVDEKESVRWQSKKVKKQLQREIKN